VGDVKGVIKMFSLLMVQDKLQCTSSTEVWSYSDRLQVTKLFTLPHDITDKCPITLIAVKSSSVIAVALDKDGTVVATCPYLIGNLSVTGKFLCVPVHCDTSVMITVTCRTSAHTPNILVIQS
jgi:hypothetical protein